MAVLVGIACLGVSPKLRSPLHVTAAHADDGGDGGGGGDGGDGGDDGGENGDDGDGGLGGYGDDDEGFGDEFGFDAYGLAAYGIIDVAATASGSIGQTANGIGDAVESAANNMGIDPGTAQAMGNAAAIAAQDAIDAGKSVTDVGIAAAAAAGQVARDAGYDTSDPGSKAEMGQAVAGALPCC